MKIDAHQLNCRIENSKTPLSYLGFLLNILEATDDWFWALASQVINWSDYYNQLQNCRLSYSSLQVGLNQLKEMQKSSSKDRKSQHIFAILSEVHA